MRIEVLGEGRVVVDGVARPLPEGQRGLLLQMLLLRPNETVAVTELIEALWPRVDPDTGIGRLRVTATRLRRSLTDDIHLEATAAGYRLDLPVAALDRLEFETLAQQAQDGDSDAARAALALWRDEPYLGFVASSELQRQRRRLLALHTELQAMVGPSHMAHHASPVLALQVDDAAPRPRLLDQMPPVGEARLIVLTAPAGYGKSVLLAQWARRENRRVEWRRLTGADNDPKVFWETLAATLGVSIGHPTRHDAPREEEGGDTVAQLVDWVINRVIDSDGPIGVVLDDFHHITNPDVHARFRRFLRRSPGHLTVAIASRRSLPFPTGRLQAGGQVLTLTAADLAFTPDEATAALLSIQKGANQQRWCHEDKLHEVHQVTAGWPQATARVMSVMPEQMPDPVDAWVTERLTDEMLDRVLAEIPTDLTELMVETAHLHHLDGDICGAVTGHDDCDSKLATLATDHHLLTKVNGGYRHHPFLAGMLRHRLERGEDDHVAELHARAGRWWLDHDRPDLALDHAAAADDPELVSQSLAPAVRHAVDRAQAASLRRWVESVAFPIPVGFGDDPHPVAMLALSFLAPEERNRWLPDGPRAAHDTVTSTVKAIDLLREGRCVEALAAVDEARRLLSTGSDPATTEATRVAERLLSVAETDCRILLGGSPEEESVDPLAAGAEPAPWPWITLWAIGQRALHAYIAGSLDLAQALLDYAETRCRDLHPSWPLLGDGSASLTEALLELDQASTATLQRQGVEIIEKIVRRCDDTGRVPMGIIARYGLSLAHRRAGDEQAATARLAEADTERARLPNLVYLDQVRDRLEEMERQWTRLAGMDSLTPRERTVLELLDTDLTLTEIASEMYLSVHTVRAHTRSIYRKLGVHQRSEAIWMARQGESPTTTDDPNR